MKRISINITILLVSLTSWSQTNTFPSSGNVGIGTTNPNVNLEITSSADTELLIRSGANENSVIDFSESAGTTGFQIGQDGATNLFYISGGSPSTTTKHLTIKRNSGDVGFSSNLTIDNSKYIYMGSVNDRIKAESGSIGIYPNSDLYIGAVVSGGEVKNATFLENGNVGIGTTNPDQKLHIEKSGNTFLKLVNTSSNGSTTYFGPVSSNGYKETQLQFESEFGLYDHSQTAWRFNIKSNGNIGIGTIEPDDVLEVSGGITINGLDRGTSDADWGSLSGKPVYTLFSSRAEGIDNSLHGFGSIKMTHFESPYIYGYNASGNMIVMGSVSAGDRNPSTGLTPRMVVDLHNGNVGIGTTNPTQKLEVAGTIRSREVKVELAAGTGPDYVFEPDYDLLTLEETKEYIEEHKHLPEIPSAREMEENGIEIGDMNMRLLKKIEELTLYQIELLERLEKAENQIIELKESR